MERGFQSTMQSYQPVGLSMIRSDVCPLIRNILSRAVQRSEVNYLNMYDVIINGTPNLGNQQFTTAYIHIHKGICTELSCHID